MTGTERGMVATCTSYLNPCASNAMEDVTGALSGVIVEGHSALESVGIFTSLRRRPPLIRLVLKV